LIPYTPWNERTVGRFINPFMESSRSAHLIGSLEKTGGWALRQRPIGASAPIGVARAHATPAR